MAQDIYIYKIIPLTKLPRPHVQTPAYFSADNFTIGQLVEVPLGKRNILGVVASKEKAETKKQDLRKSSFALKKINKPVTQKPVFSKKFLKTAIDLADYYYAPRGLMLRRMLPPFFNKPTKKLLKMLEETPPTKTKEQKAGKKTLLIDQSREKTYKQNKTGNMLIAPEYLRLNSLSNLFSNGAVFEQNIKQTQWRDMWINARAGNVKNILGTRANLFTPFKNLQRIIIENENNSSHKSWDQHPKFDVRLAAQYLSDTRGVNLTYGDSIPSTELWQKAQLGNWTIKKSLPANPKIEIVDMAKELKDGNSNILSVQLQNILKNAGKNSKIFLFINRKGLAGALICRDCGRATKCKQCDAALVVHKGSILICHHCGKKYKQPAKCPYCNSAKIKTLGAGTELIDSVVKRIAPNLEAYVLDADLVKNTKEQERVLKDFKAGKFNVLISTQYGLKDYMLPSLDYSAVVMADTILNLPDYKATEKVYEIMWRLKAKTSKKFIAQTYIPGASAFKHIKDKDFEKFFTQELKKRKLLNWPPYSQLVKLTFAHADAQKAEHEAGILKQKLQVQLKNIGKQLEIRNYKLEIDILGPAPAFVPKVKGKYIWYILIKWPLDKNGNVVNLPLRNRMLQVVPPNWDIDVDPISIV